MAAFSVPSNPDFNVTHVEQIKESDYVVNTFMNPYLLIFLQNDRYLLNKITSFGDEVDTKIESAQVDGVTSDQMTILLNMIN